MRVGRSVALMCLLLTGAACDYTGGEDETIIGSGTMATEERAVDVFDEVSIEGFGRVIVEIGPAPSLVIEAEDNVIPYLVTKVEGEALVISTEDGTSFRDVTEPVYTITTPSLSRVSIAGSGDVSAVGVAAERFEAWIGGSGDIAVVGSVGSLSVLIEGSGSFEGAELAATDAVAEIAGSGSIVVNATGRLEATVGGSGSIVYLGDPTVTESIGGSGSITRG